MPATNVAAEMDAPNRGLAKVGLVLILLSWGLVSAVEIVGNPGGFVMPVSRFLVAVILAAGVMKGSRGASVALLVWSIVGHLLGGFLGELMVLGLGVWLFLWGGGSKAFRPIPPSIEATGQSPPV